MQSNFKTVLTAALGNAATDLNIYLDTMPTNSTGYLVIDPEGSAYELIYYESKTTTYVTCPASNGRGLSLTATTRTGVSANIKVHGAGKKVILSPDHYLLNDKASKAGDTFTGAVDFSGASSTLRLPNLTTTERNALTATLGMKIYNTTTGEEQTYIGGSWIVMAAGGTFPDASTTVAGKVEEATAAETIAGTAAGATLARLFVNPSGLMNAAVSTVASAGAADAAKFVRTGADGFIDQTMLPNLKVEAGGGITNGASGLALTNPDSLSLTAGENIDGSATPKAVFISPGTTAADTFPLQVQETEADVDADIWGVNYGAETFTTGTYQTVLTQIDLLLMKVTAGSVSGNINVNIYAVDGSHKPTGVSLGNKTYTANDVAATYLRWVSFTFASPITVIPATEYAIRMTVTSGDGSNYIEWQVGSGNCYAGGVPWTSADAGSTWSAGANDFAFRAWGYEPQTAGRVYMSDSDEPFRGGVDGFVTSNTAAGAVAVVAFRGKLTTSGLTAGAIHYVSSTPGVLTATAGGRKVGRATSTTELDIDFAGGFVEKTVLTSPCLGEAVTTPLVYEDVFNCGFKPSRVELEIALLATGGGGADGRQYAFNGRYVSSLYGIGRWDALVASAGVQHGRSSLVSAASSYVAKDTAASEIVTVGEIVLTNTGLYCTTTLAGTSTGTSSIQAIFYR